MTLGMSIKFEHTRFTIAKYNRVGMVNSLSTAIIEGEMVPLSVPEVISQWGYQCEKCGQFVEDVMFTEDVTRKPEMLMYPDRHVMIELEQHDKTHAQLNPDAKIITVEGEKTSKSPQTLPIAEGEEANGAKMGDTAL